jgi:phosphate transport system substrate-binding protein
MMKPFMQRRSMLLFALAALVPATPFALTPAAHRQRMQLSGSTTMAPLMVEIGKRFQRRYPAVGFDIALGGSGRGILDAREGKVDIGMVSRALDAAENDLHGTPIARDGVALIVHRDNPVRQLTQAQLFQLYTGAIANWRQLGGRNAPLKVLAGPAEGGSSEQFSHYLKLPYASLVAHGRVANNADRISAVANDPNAIIFVSVGEAERRARAGAPIRLLTVDGVSPTSTNVRTENYPMSRPLTLVTRHRPTGITRSFIEFCVSSQVTDLILSFDFIPYLD